MTIASFYANYVLPNRPPNTPTINLKQTRYKKFGVYISEKALEEPYPLIQVDSQRNMLLDFNKRHPDYKAFLQSIHCKTGKSLSIPHEQQRLLLLDLYIIPHNFVSLLRLSHDDVKCVNATSVERKNTGMLLAKEAKDILDTYIEKENLVQPDNTIQLDGPLTDALYGKSKKMKKPQLEEAQQPLNHEQVSLSSQPMQPPQFLSRKNVATLWMSKMEPAFAIVQPGSSTGEDGTVSNKILKLGRGRPPCVEIHVVRARSKKFVTRVRGMEHFGISATVLAKDVSIRFACAASVDTSPEKSGHPALPTRIAGMGEPGEVVLQGNWHREIEALLLGDESLSGHGGVKGSPYCLPKKSIQVVLANGVPQQKKK